MHSESIDKMNENDLTFFSSVQTLTFTNSEKASFIFLMDGLTNFFSAGKHLSSLTIEDHFESAPWSNLPSCPAHLVILQIQTADIKADDIAAM